MSFLLHREHESIFVDLNILFSVDYFVVDKIYRYLNCTNDMTDPFYRLKRIVDGHKIGYDVLGSIVQNKHHVNPLLDYMDNPNKEVADTIYKGILFDDEIKIDDLYLNLQKTSLGKAFTTLLKDTNLDHLYIYTGAISTPLHSHIYSNLPEISKIDLVVGEKESFLRDISCDNYFFEDVNDTKFLLDKKFPKMVSVYAPEYVFNMREDIPEFVKFDIPVDELESKHNITINTIKLPF